MLTLIIVVFKVEDVGFFPLIPLDGSKNTFALANGIRGYTDKTHLRGFQILRVRVGGLRLYSRDF